MKGGAPEGRAALFYERVRVFVLKIFACNARVHV